MHHARKINSMDQQTDAVFANDSPAASGRKRWNRILRISKKLFQHLVPLTQHSSYRWTFHQQTSPNTYRNGKKDKSRLFTDIHYKDAPWVTRTSRPFEITADWRDAISLCGKVTENTTSITKTNGVGSVRACSVPPKTNSHNRSSCLTSSRCWKMREPTYSPLANGTRKNRKSL